MIIPPLLSPSFWFNPNPPPFIPVINTALIVVILAFIVAGIAAYLYRRKTELDKLDRQKFGRIGRLCLTFGITSLFLYAIAFERVNYLSMRIFWIPLFAWAIWDAWKLWMFVTKKLPEIRKAQAEREQYEKWLPKRKK